VEVNKLHFSSRALYDLTDAFFEMLTAAGKKFINQPFGQVGTRSQPTNSSILAATSFQRIDIDRGANGK